MRMKKELNKFCKYCKKHTGHVVKIKKSGGRSKTHPLGQWAKHRMKARGLISGFGSNSKLSKGVATKWKRHNKKHTKRWDLRYTCQECNKQSVKAKGTTRAKKLVIE